MHHKLVLVVCTLALSLALVGSVNVASAAPSSNYGAPTWHYVHFGETLFSIGRLYGVNPWAIASANNLPDPNKIYVGQRLYIPAGYPYYSGYPPAYGRYYSVQIGDTMLGIGRKYGISPWKIAAANGIYNLNYIYVGQVLYIP